MGGVPRLEWDIDFLGIAESKTSSVRDLDPWAVGTTKMTFLVWESERQKHHKERVAAAFVCLKVVWDFPNSKKMMEPERLKVHKSEYQENNQIKF